MNKLHDWQQVLLEGMKQGELLTVNAGRQTGKSYVQQFLHQWVTELQDQHPFEKLDSAIVDGEPWHTVECNREVSAWVRQQPKSQWYEHKQQARHLRGIFDMPESLFIIMSMKWA